MWPVEDFDADDPIRDFLLKMDYRAYLDSLVKQVPSLRFVAFRVNATTEPPEWFFHEEGGIFESMDHVAGAALARTLLQ